MLEERFFKKQYISLQKKNSIIKNIIDYFSKRDDVVFAYIYGSFVLEKYFRDIDIGLYTKKTVKEVYLESDISYDLFSITDYQVDVKIINGAPVNFQMTLLQKGILLFCNDENKRTDFIENVSKRYIEYSHLKNIIMSS